MSGICQQAQILILKILDVFLWLIPIYRDAFPRSKPGIFDLTLDKFKRFETTSTDIKFYDNSDTVVCRQDGILKNRDTMLRNLLGIDSFPGGYQNL